jgi:F0F1-type ATP synthase membrane subunit b/b'
MSAIETVKVIVEAERQAARMIDDANAKAADIRKTIDSRIQEQRQRMLADAKKEASYIAARAEEEGKREAEQQELGAVEQLRQLVARASAKREPTIEKLVSLIMQVQK